MSDLPETMAELRARLERLERRVEALEGAQAVAVAEPVAAASLSDSAGEPAFPQAAGGFGTVGRALLGIAGAYALRAVAEGSALPRAAVAAVAIAYALAWLAGAARARGAMAQAVYAATSGLILAPMLWELTLRFQVFPASVTAAVLAGYVAAAFGLAWRRRLEAVIGAASLATAAAALALGVATGRLELFLAVLLFLAALSEAAGLSDRAGRVRLLAALAADVAVAALLFVYSGPVEARASYPALGAAALVWPGCALFLVYALSLGVRTLVQERRVGSAETLQAMAAYLLAATGLVLLAPEWGQRAMGAASLALCAASYTAAFLRFDAGFESGEERRNFRVYSGWAAGLLVAGCVLSLQGLWLTAALCAAAMAATLAGALLDRRVLGFHGLVYLAGAAVVSGAPGAVLHAFAGAGRGLPGAAFWMVAVAALVCYGTAKHRVEERWLQQALHLAEALLAAGAVAALALKALLGLAALVLAPEAPHVAVARSLVLCLAALGLAWAGAHWRRLELRRVAWAVLALLAVKLLLEDMQLGAMGFTAVSMVLFALALIAVPRLMRAGERI